MTATVRHGAAALTVASLLLVCPPLRAQQAELPARAGAAALATGEATFARILDEARPGRAVTGPRAPGAGELSARELAFPRVRRAYAAKDSVVRRLFSDAGIDRAAAVFFRVFKREKVLEVWARDAGHERFVLLKRYPVCKVSGRLGPKRKVGDLQVPEGFYTLDSFNPQSRYLLSMRVSYPNAVDRARGPVRDLGGDIYVHGGCASIGCIAVGNEWIQELYVIAMEARHAGQREIPIHIFPTRLDDEGLHWLARTYSRRYLDYPFWESLQAGYLAFERTHRLPDIEQRNGRYVIGPGPAPLLGTSIDSFALAIATRPGG